MLKVKNSNVYNLTYAKSYLLDNISNILNIDIKKSDETIKLTYSKISNSKIKNEFFIFSKHYLESGLKTLIL